MTAVNTPPFVVIEGLDGAGTTTQTRRVAEALESKGHVVDVSCEPSGGPIGSLIRQMLSLRVGIPEGDGRQRAVGRQTLALLFAADRLDHLEARIEPALGAGKIAISDRYYHSSLAYQGDVDEDDSVDYGWVRQINARARVPDLTVFLQARTELCLSRLSSRGQRDIYESKAKLERLERRYDEVMNYLADEGQTILRLDASRPMAELTEEITLAILSYYDKSSS